MTVVIEPERVVGGATLTSVQTPTHSRVARNTEWCLRIGAAACFIGHGAFGILTKEAWVAYFAIAGIDRDLAFTLMPIIGGVDIAAGLTVLISPRPIVLWYMVVWGIWTATLRPLAGESIFETLERAGNYGVPLALLVFYGMRSRAPLVRLRSPDFIDRARVARVLLWTTATLLFAHGALQAIAAKPLFTALYGAVGLSPSVVQPLGIIEMVAAFLVVISPTPALLLAIAAWKITTEALFPLSGTPIWEFVERGGSYAAPIGLVLLSGQSAFTRITLSRSTP